MFNLLRADGDCLLRHRWVMVLWLIVTAAMWLWEWVTGVKEGET